MAHAIDQASTELFRRTQKQTRGRELTLVPYPSVVQIPAAKTSLPSYFLANLTPNCVISSLSSPHFWSHFCAILPQAHFSRDSRCITYQRTLTHLPLVCHLIPYQNLLSHHRWNIIATAGFARDKPYGFSDLRAAVELHIG